MFIELTKAQGRRKVLVNANHITRIEERIEGLRPHFTYIYFDYTKGYADSELDDAYICVMESREEIMKQLNFCNI